MKKSKAIKESEELSFEEVKELVNMAIETDDPKVVKKIIAKIRRSQYPGCVEAIESGVSEEMLNKL